MKVIVWVVRIILFMLVLTFSIRNTDPVKVRWILGLEVEVQLVLALLLAFLVGAFVAWVFLLPSWMRAKRNAMIALRSAEKLQQELSSRDQQSKPSASSVVESSASSSLISSTDGI